MREIDFLDGFVSSAEPVLGDLITTSLKCFASDGAFVAAKTNPVAECGDLYYNSTLDAIRRYGDDLEWHTIADLELDQTFSGDITFGKKILLKNGAGGGLDVSAAGTLEMGATATEVSIASSGVLTRVLGDLRVEGATTQVQTAVLDVEDKNVTVNKGGDDLASEGAGLTVDRTGTKGSIIYAAAAATKFKAGSLGAEVELADISTAQSLTNKTIDADSNTITNIENSEIKAGAAIERSKLASGTANHVLINDGSGVMSSEASLDETRGGTGQTGYATGDILYAANATTLGKLGIGANDEILRVVGGVPVWDVEAGGIGSGFNVDSILVDEAGDVVTEDGNVITDNTDIAPSVNTLGQTIKSVQNGSGGIISIGYVCAWLDNGKVTLADANSTYAATADFAGIAKTAGADGTYIDVIKSGLIPGALSGLGATPGQRVYLGEAPGTITLTPPGGGGDTVYQLGIAEPAAGVGSPTAEDLHIMLAVISEP